MPHCIASRGKNDRTNVSRQTFMRCFVCVNRPACLLTWHSGSWWCPLPCNIVSYLVRVLRALFVGCDKYSAQYALILTAISFLQCRWMISITILACLAVSGFWHLYWHSLHYISIYYLTASLQGSAKALVRWGGNIYRLLIGYSLSNILAIELLTYDKSYSSYS